MKLRYITASLFSGTTGLPVAMAGLLPPCGAVLRANCSFLMPGPDISNERCSPPPFSKYSIRIRLMPASRLAEPFLLTTPCTPSFTTTGTPLTNNREPSSEPRLKVYFPLVLISSSPSITKPKLSRVSERFVSAMPLSALPDLTGLSFSKSGRLFHEPL